MKTLNVLGLTLFSVGVFALVGYGLYKFFVNSSAPIIVRSGVIAIILGLFVLLFSLINERLKEKEDECEDKSGDQD